MKRCCALLFCLLFFALFAAPSAFAESLIARTAGEMGLDELDDALSQAERDVTGTLTLDGSYDTQGALARLWENMRDELRARFRAELAFALRLAVLPILCAMAEAMTEQKSAKEAISLAACCAAAVFFLSDWQSGYQQALETLTSLSDYSRAALPVLYTAAAASGAVSSAPLKYAASSLAIEVMMTLSRRLVLPLIESYLALSLCACVCENSLVAALTRLVKYAAVTVMSAVSSGFCLYIGLTGLVAGSTDAAAVKAARTVIASVLPVVGGILSDSAASILAAAGVVRSTAGVFALIALAALCSGPFIFLIIKMLLLRAVSTLAELLPGGKLSRLLEQFSSVFGMLLGLLGGNGLMLFFSLMAGMKAVTV